MTPNGRVVSRIAALVVAAVGQAVVGWFTAASGLLAPLWAVVVLAVVWVAATVLLIRVGRRRPLAAPLVPLANALVWWAVLTLGGALLGWSA